MSTTEASWPRSSVVAVADDPLLELLRVLADVTGEGSDWRELALCAQTDQDTFFPGGQSSGPARRGEGR